MDSAIAEPLKMLMGGWDLLRQWMLGSMREHRDQLSIQRYGE
jgi:hypothetical protein